jgi:hypothetical protein
VVQQIATALGETKPAVLGQSQRIVQTIGEERALALLQHALEREQHGGLLLSDGKRRTPGGVFFRFVKEQTTPKERRQIWFYQGRAKAAPQTEQRSTS